MMTSHMTHLDQTFGPTGPNLNIEGPTGPDLGPHGPNLEVGPGPETPSLCLMHFFSQDGLG